MKKILSLALALIMMLSVMPMAFAAEKSLTDIYIEEALKLYTYGYNVYDNPDFKYYIKDTYFTDHIGGILGFDQWFADTQEEIPAKLEILKEINAELEQRIAAGEATVLVDTSDFVQAYITWYFMYIFFDIDVEEMAFYYINHNNVNYDELSADFEKIDEIIENNGGATQAEFDALAEDVNYIHNLIVKHALGEHDFIEYISNNDATEEADGTKTATCGICGATDTVVDEGSQLKKEPATFIEKIIEFFRNLLEKLFSFFKF